MTLFMLDKLDEKIVFIWMIFKFFYCLPLFFGKGLILRMICFDCKKGVLILILIGVYFTSFVVAIAVEISKERLIEVNFILIRYSV